MIQVGDWLAESSSVGRDLSRQQVKHEQAVLPCREWGKGEIKEKRKKYSSSILGCINRNVISKLRKGIRQTTARVLCPVLESPVQDRH